ncbi:alpha carbonic anhydrase [Fragilariopsis cylindrus CCMP1102]|uniref:carbonic anhydrase n=1 Tax=Fragilariopsis cylindrus CCMP1102 TaxID=635003 RepID=A0A1E7F4K7_9STRA|nr:alpha carbonic anhydrase [Fragilariopsis cylindrus CCMP1102]|eukprot:OEU13118.1 alpha carbonic anhydrase [Fragilariopsis cylindrus CCMP1102]
MTSMLTTGKNPVFGLLSSIVKVFLLFFFFFVSSHTSRIVSAKNNSTHFLDRFNYDTTTTNREDGFIDYGPKDWGKIKCDERTTESLDQCEGYPHKWHEGINFTVTDNYCRWCPVGSDECGRHHQSPINLLREVGLDPNTSFVANECIDLHWMKYEDSFCSMEELVKQDQFTIERHGLRIGQPITVYKDMVNDTDGVADGVKLECRVKGRGSKFGRIDFSKGFSDWWYLSHTDLHVPSEHTQEGKRYDAEIQMYHFYSIDYDNEMAAISVFMNAYDDAPPYRYLDKVICRWREKEFSTRKQCGLDPIEFSYPGCFPLTPPVWNLKTRIFNSNSTEGIPQVKKHPVRTVADAIYHNELHRDDPYNNQLLNIHMDEVNLSPAEEKDWDIWISEQSEKMDDDESLYRELLQEEYNGGDETEWFNYWPMLGARTEYYYRYQGTATIPPCYGSDTRASKRGVNHWRVLKDPIRIQSTQLKELERLIRDRIAPPDDPVMPCQPDTAAKVSDDGRVNVARPLMSTDEEAHDPTFCECKDWVSKWPEDQAWCETEDLEERLYLTPYNFESDGF